MRSLSGGILLGLGLLTDVFAGEVDYSKFARVERTQLAKCFSNVLVVRQRHRLRNHLVGFLYASCEAESREYEDAFFLAIQNEPEVKQYDVSEFVRSYAIRSTARALVGSMASTARELYREEPLSFCTGGGCPLEQYHKCLLLQAAEEVTKRTKPRDFENIAQEKCRPMENEARIVLTIDFANVQKHQKDPELSGEMRDLINQVITDLRRETVISYADDLTRIEPSRRSCRPKKICGDGPCIPVGGDPEYECAIGD